MSKKESITSKIERLKSDVEWFYGDTFVLDEAVDRYKGVSKLAKEIERDLEEMKNEVVLAKQDFTK
jgi:hypothetical protein